MLSNNFMLDPLGQRQQQQQHQQQQQGNQSRSNNQLSVRSSANPFDPFSNMFMSPFERHNAIMQQHHQSINNPFALMNQMMMGSAGGLFRNFEPNVINADPSAQVYSSSSVISYSNVDGKPKVYQSSTQTRHAPGGVKETRHMIRDSEKGIEKVSVGHHIGDRAHIIERQKHRGGDMEEVVNLENLDDEEVPEFNQEFENKIAAAHYRSTHNNHHGSLQPRSIQSNHHHHLNNNQPLAIEDSSSRRKERERKSKSKSSSKH